MASHSYRNQLFLGALLVALAGCDALADWHQSRPNEWDAAPRDEAVRAARERRAPVRVIRGVATWYGPGFHGKQTASGERFDMYGLSAAHRTLPFGTRIRVINEANGRAVVVRVTDRGPFARGKILDLSKGAAQRIGLDRVGTGPVRIEVLR